MSNFKSLHLISDSREIGGAENHMLTLAKGLSAEKFDVNVVVRTGLVDYFEYQLNGSTKVVALPESLFGWAKYCMNNRPAIFHFHLTHYTSGMRLHLMAVAVGVTSIATLHSLEQQATTTNAARLLGRKLHRLIFNRFNIIIAPSRFVAERLVNIRNAPRERVRVVHNGIAERSGRPKTFTARAVGDPLKVVIIGRLARDKGHKVLFKAIKLIASDVKIACQVVGEGLYRQELEEFVHGNGLRKHVSFLGFRTDVDQVLRGSDVLVVPSTPPTGENFPLTTLEAMAAGVPVVASNIGGIPEQIDDGQTGFLVEPSNVEELAKVLQQLYVTPAKARKVAIKARSAYLDKFTDKHMIEQLRGIYNGL